MQKNLGHSTLWRSFWGDVLNFSHVHYLTTRKWRPWFRRCELIFLYR